MLKNKLLCCLLALLAIPSQAATLEDPIREIEIGTIISMRKSLLVPANETAPLWERGNGIDPKNTCEITTNEASAARTVSTGSRLTVKGFGKNSGKDHVEILVEHPIIQSIKMWSEGYSIMQIGDLDNNSCDHSFNVRP